MDQIYFTADLHFGHPNILKHSPKRPYSDTMDIVAHDAWLLDLWRSTVDKRDTVYILVDLTFLKSEEGWRQGRLRRIRPTPPETPPRRHLLPSRIARISK